ncbi:MAG: coproporphyrinogen dehydrogenase HemZ [Oscillospiraceae bacterium]|jgi:oxygen-independent coproporphyrinogen-3 oxidase|nr:coproporphyrinogen dehydrogenase HemZ [Oscillospiraceae bacterium]
MILYVFNHKYHYELENLCRVFFPQEKIQINRAGGASLFRRGRLAKPLVAITRRAEDTLRVCLYTGARRLRLSRRCGENDELTLARMLFVLLRRETGCRPPWGLLTGVRPSKLMLRLRRDKGEAEAERYFCGALWVSREKTRLAAAVARAEEPILALTGPRTFSLYLAVPFCPSRCAYCSFVSHTVERASARKLIPAYVEKLCEEMARTGEIAAALGLELASVYIGGGTPTILSAQQMRQICEALRRSFAAPGEFTVEAGRPDTITAEKLCALKEHGVTRLSVNPQSMNDEVLAAAGRRHTAQEVLEAYALARGFGFGAINMDLIAGLPGDTPEGFCASLRRIIALRPENITVHTLALKRSAQWGGAGLTDAGVARMLRAAAELLPAAGYAPYYMYRQSRSLGNLENIGWSLPGHACRYNVDMMEESHTILACGAGGVTKLKQYGTDYLERVFSLKYPYEYLARFEELLRRKESMKAFYQTYNSGSEAASDHP